MERVYGCMVCMECVFVEDGRIDCLGNCMYNFVKR